MYTKIKIEAAYSKHSDKKKSKKIEAFRRFEFNHPLNPFRLTADKTRLHLNHLNAKQMNESFISCFDKKIDKIQSALAYEEKEIDLVSALTNELYDDVSTFSTIPFTSNIDTSVFEHLNYILQLLYDWQDYALILKEIKKDTPNYIHKISQKYKISTPELISKINYFNRKFEVLTQEILSEILKIKATIKNANL